MAVEIHRRIPSLDADSSDDEVDTTTGRHEDESSDSSVGRPDDMDKAVSSEDEAVNRVKGPLNADSSDNESVGLGKVRIISQLIFAFCLLFSLVLDSFVVFINDGQVTSKSVTGNYQKLTF
jgi:hypothetical protein